MGVEYMDSLKKSLIWFFLILLCGLPISFLAFGSDIQTQINPLYPFRSSIFLQEDFISGSNTNGTIGVLGMGITGGTAGVIASEANRFGLIRRDTGAVAGTVANTNLIPNISTAFTVTNPHQVIWVVRLNVNNNNTEARHGSMNLITANPPANGIYIEKAAADTNWFCVTRSGGVQTRTDSGVAVDTNFHTFRYTLNSSGAMFSIDNAGVCGTHTTNLPTGFATPTSQLSNIDAVAKSADYDYFQFNVGLTR